MTETGTIISIEHDRYIVECAQNPDCHSCTHCDKGREHRRMEARNPAGLELETGNRVEVYLAPGKTIMASFLVLIVPLMLFILFYYVGRRLLPRVSDPVLALLGIAGIAVGFLLNLTFKRKPQDLPRITRILDESVETRRPESLSNGA